uniref:Reverse transcriptase domain-containing protein n=1 Tax=Graphocephala atropunctata TaxID=36148 RepID=A0A1B6LYM7_9HEMI
MEKNKILSPNQFRFTKGKSSTDAMFSLIKNIVQNLDRGNSTVGMFFDLTKAFDMIDQNILLEKLSCLGLRGVSHSWIKSFLCGRGHMVKIPYIDKFGCKQVAQSSTTSTLRGVPQDSVLGPILFLLFINDLPSCVQNESICLYADDTSISISTRDRPELEVRAYEQTSALVQWFNENELILNSAKTQILDFNIRNPSNNDIPMFLVEDQEISPCSVTKFLGVNIDRNLKFDQQVDSVCRRLSSGVFVLKRLGTFAETEVLLSAYYGLIHPFLSYGVAIWGYECARTHFLFRLQKKAVRAIFKKPNRFSCKSRFKDHKILTFPSIFILNTVIFVRNNLSLFSSETETNNYNLRTKNKITIPKHRTEFFKNHLVYNGVRLYNALPDSLRSMSSDRSFKKGVKGLLMDECCYSVGEFLLQR